MSTGCRAGKTFLVTYFIFYASEYDNINDKPNKQIN